MLLVFETEFFQQPVELEKGYLLGRRPFTGSMAVFHEFMIALINFEMAAAVFGPGSFIVARINGFFLAIADRI